METGIVETGTLSFTTDFDWLTGFIRSLWAEGSYRRALDVLDELGISKNVSYDIIRGRARMIQDPEGKKGIDGKTTKDNWIPDLSMCDRGRYPDPSDLYRIEKNRDIYAKRYIDECVVEAYSLLEELTSDVINGNGEWIVDVELKISSLPDEVFDIVGVSRDIYYEHLQMAMLEVAQKERREKELDEYIEHQLELDTKPLPEPDLDMSTSCGWLLPNGKYYPCNWRDHIWLVRKLGKSEEEAEKEGWIKFTLSGIWSSEDVSPTQKQIDMVFMWCKKHDAMNRWKLFQERLT